MGSRRNTTANARWVLAVALAAAGCSPDNPPGTPASSLPDNSPGEPFVRPNRGPLAKIVAPASAPVGARVRLDAGGSADEDGDALTYTWTQIGGPAVTDLSTDGPVLTFDAPKRSGRLTFRCTVSDGETSASAVAAVHISNSAPVARATASAAVEGGARVRLDGTASSDPEGEPLTYHWRQTGGPLVDLEDAGGPTPSFFAPDVHDELRFSLTVSDGEYESEPAHVRIRVRNHAPVAMATGPERTAGGETVVLDATASTDFDGDALTYRWAQIGGAPVALDDETSATPAFVAPAGRSTLVFRVTVSDGQDEDEADVAIALSNRAPIAVAGGMQAVDGGATVALDGAASYDPDGDAVQYHWVQEFGPAAELDNPFAPDPKFTAPAIPGEMVFALVVDDGLNQSAAARTRIVVGDRPPVAHAGRDLSVRRSGRVTLDGRASSDADGHELTFAWRQVAGPAVVMDDPTSPTPSFDAPSESATLAFDLVVHDGIARSEPARTRVFVDNSPPIADAGADQITEAGRIVMLDGTASRDADGDAVTPHWRQIGGERVALRDAGTLRPWFQAPEGRQALEFELIGTDGLGEGAPDTVRIHVGNRPPMATVGRDPSVRPGELVTLDASGSRDPDGDALTYTWRQVAGPRVELSDVHAAQPTFLAPTERATLVFEVDVSDGITRAAAARAQVAVANRAPRAIAGDPQTAMPGERITLDGGASSDGDGDPLAYRWTQTGGTPVELAPDGAKASFIAPEGRERLSFALVVNDGLTDSAPAEALVHLGNRPPMADAGEARLARRGMRVHLDGRASNDPDGDALRYRWTQIEGPAVQLAGAETSNPSFDPPAERANLRFALVVSDGLAESEPSTVAVQVENAAPIADAGRDQPRVAQGAVVTLDGRGSADPDGDQLQYLWTQLDGPPVALTDETAARTAFLAPDAKRLMVFQLVVTDGLVESEPDVVVVDTANSSPVADAGPDIEVDGGELVMLDGRRSGDRDADAVQYRWTQIEGPQVELSNPTAVAPTFRVPQPRATYRFRLDVTDGVALTSDEVVVRVRNHSPLADAGLDLETEGGELMLDGTASRDPDGDTLAFVWTQTGGDPVDIDDPTLARPTVSIPGARGDYRFLLTVSDAAGHASSDEVAIHVGNHAPQALAGRDRIVEGGARVVLDGTSSRDADGDALTYEWTQTEGPAVHLDDATSATPSFTAPTARGTLGFALKVADSSGAVSALSSVRIDVANNAPLADAGADREVRGGAFVVLDGTGTRDLDGDGLSYQWTQIAGAPVALNDADGPLPSFNAPGRRGALTFKLNVSDGELQDNDVVTIAVANHAPVAHAGDDVDAPAGEIVTLDGRRSADLDGDELAYHWTQIGGPAVALDDPRKATPSFLPAEGRGLYEFALTVNDGIAGATDRVIVVVGNERPVADAGEDRDGIAARERVTLDGSASLDGDGDALTFRWRQVEGPEVVLDGADTERPYFTAPAGRHAMVFELVVADGLESAADRVTLLTENALPTADASADFVAWPGAIAGLRGSDSTDPDGDPLTCAWRQLTGEPIELEDADTCNPHFRAPVERGGATFELTVDDGFGGTATDLVTMTVETRRPFADAGEGGLVQPGDLVTLDGTGSSDEDGDALSYLWTQVGGPLVPLMGADSAQPTFVVPDLRGRLEFELKVFDGAVWSEPARVVIDVANAEPEADAGGDVTVEGGSRVELDGSASFDTDGDALSYQWVQFEGIPVNLDDADTAAPSFTAPATRGSLAFALIVDDGFARSAFDVVRVEIANQLPVVDAGADLEAAAGSLVTLDAGASTDGDGDALAYEWEQIDGPRVALSDRRAGRTTFVAPDAEATLTFRVRAHDGEAWSDWDDVVVTVSK